MTAERGSDGRTVTRRDVLGSTAAGAAGVTAGCLQRTQTLLSRDSPNPVQIDVMTVPADQDVMATRIGRMLETNLTAVGIDAELVLVRRQNLRRDVLLNQDFDIFVDLFPEYHDPDFLRPLLHSSFSNESGWQNPFGYADLETDERLVRQKGQAGQSRRDTVDDLQRSILADQPFVTLLAPEEIRAVGDDRFSGWDGVSLRDPLGFVRLESRTAETDQLRVVLTDDRVTLNLNPIALEFRNRGAITGLLYDSLARRYDGAVRPWLAGDWVFEERASETVATVTLRPDLRWHDGSPITADDAAFTFRFLNDTRLGEGDREVPAPRFRGRTSLVDGVEAVDDRTLRLRFPETSAETAVRSLTVPLLPQSEWETTATDADIAGVDAPTHVTEALVWANESPVGSGVLAFEDRTAGEQLRLTRFDDHFLHRDPPAEPAERFDGGVAFAGLVATVVESDNTAVQLVNNGEMDATISHLTPEVVPSIGRGDASLHVDRTRSFYMVGCNTSQEPLGNPHIRRLVARLLDKEHIRSEVFDGFARPLVSPLAGTGWLAPGLEWAGADPEVPFFGSDGELDADAARESLREAGFQFSENGALLHQ